MTLVPMVGEAEFVARGVAAILTTRPNLPIDGNFASWNLRFEYGHLTGFLDFELARTDHRIADFALAGRGKRDAVIGLRGGSASSA